MRLVFLVYNYMNYPHPTYLTQPAHDYRTAWKLSPSF